MSLLRKGTLTRRGGLPTPIIVDSWHSDALNSILSVWAIYPVEPPAPNSSFCAMGETFKPNRTAKITSAHFYLRKSGNPTGTMRARLYNMGANVYGDAGKPSFDLYPTITTPLAVSDVVDMSILLATFAYVEFPFSGGQRYAMVKDTPYCIAFMPEEGSSIDTANYIQIGGNLSGGHSGNGFIYFYDGTDSRWGGFGFPNTSPRCFKVYGV